jgi:hypothetical protein
VNTPGADPATLVAALHGLWTFVDTSLEQDGADRTYLLEETRDRIADILRLAGQPIDPDAKET